MKENVKSEKEGRQTDRQREREKNGSKLILRINENNERNNWRAEKFD